MSNRMKCMIVGLAWLGLVGCEESEDSGRDAPLAVFVYGEAFIEEGIPAAQMEDGWAVSFDSFVVEIRQISIAGALAPDAVQRDLTEPTNGEGQEIHRFTVAEGTYGDAAYTVTSLHVAGSATKEGTTKSFDWTFDQPVRYDGCETETAVAGEAGGRFEITIHADHLFYDSLVAEEPALRFRALADADSDDGVITAEELEAAGLGAYDPGSEDIDNLWDFLVAHSATVGHVDGEGHCHAAPVSP